MNEIYRRIIIFIASCIVCFMFVFGAQTGVGNLASLALQIPAALLILYGLGCLL